MSMNEFHKTKDTLKNIAGNYTPHVERVLLRVNEHNVSTHGLDLLNMLIKACEKARLDRRLVLSYPSQFKSASYGGLMSDEDVIKINQELRDYYF